MAGQAVPGRQDQYEEVWFGPPPGLHEVALPGRVYTLNTNGDIYLVETFSGMYTDLVVALGQIEYAGVEGEVWAPGEYRSFPWGNHEDTFEEGVLYRFDFQISRGLLASWLTKFHEHDLPFETVNNIFVPSGGGPVQFINSDSRETWELQSSLAWSSVIETAVSDPRDVLAIKWVPMESGENYTVSPGVFQPLRPVLLPVPSWFREEINYSSLIRSFYLEPALTRLIQEPDGAEIFTDGFQALRIYPSGALEYTVVRYQTGTFIPGQAGMVETSLDFVTSHGGWPSNMLVTHMGIKPGGMVRMELSSYGLGIPLMGSNIGIAVELDGLAISHYNRDLIYAQSNILHDNVEIRPLSWLLSDPTTQAAQLLATLEDEITDLSLIYYWQQEQVFPVWRIWMGRQIVFIGATDGRILNVRTPSGGE
jgi:hypothetical protein